MPTTAAASEKKQLEKSLPNVTLLPGTRQLNLHNNGHNDLWLGGSKFANTPAIIEKTYRLLSAGHFYYFLTDKFEAEAQQVIGKNGEKLEPFEVYITDATNEHFIAKFLLLIKVTNGTVSIHTQQLGIVKEKWETH